MPNQNPDKKNIIADEAIHSSCSNSSSPKFKQSLNLINRLRQNRDEIYAIAQKYGVSNIRVFGSVARGEEQKNSDLDLLVDIDYKAYGSGFARVDFKQKIENFLHLNVDVLTKKSLNIHIKKQILKEVQKL